MAHWKFERVSRDNSGWINSISVDQYVLPYWPSNSELMSACRPAVSQSDPEGNSRSSLSHRAELFRFGLVWMLGDVARIVIFGSMARGY
jgi:hypothetical protein